MRHFLHYAPLLLIFPVYGVEYSAPAGIRPALRHPGAASILPGGRIISPFGHQYVTGPGPFGLAISASGKTPGLRQQRTGPLLAHGPRTTTGRLLARSQLIAPAELSRSPAKPPRRATRSRTTDGLSDWHSVFMGLAFANEHSVYASEGNYGPRAACRSFHRCGPENLRFEPRWLQDSFTGDLASMPTGASSTWSIKPISA